MKQDKLLKCLIVFTLSVSICTLSGGSTIEYRENPSGTCGDNLTWTYNPSTYTLTINGTGRMTSYNSDVYIPWKKYTSSIQTVVFAGNVTSIGGFAFYRCTNLTNITIPSTVTSIESYSFSFCESLASITIPASVSSYSIFSAGSQAFSGCSKLINITVEQGNPKMKDIDGVLFNIDGTRLLTYPSGRQGSYLIPNSVSFISGFAFSRCALNSVTIPDSVTTIGQYAFEHCSKLTTVAIPKSVTSLGTRSFGPCSSLESIDVDSDNPSFSSVDGVLYDKKVTELLEFPGGKNVTNYTISDGVVTIHRDAFFGNMRLTSLIIPASVSSVSTQTFHGCKNLEVVSYLGTSDPGTVNVFGNDNLRLICVPTEYESDTFCQMTDFAKRDKCDELQDIENHCYQASTKKGVWNVQERSNATQWERLSNTCYDYVCDNATGGYYVLKDSSADWEKQSNHCYEYECVNGVAESRKRKNATEWEAQSNECYEYKCMNEKGGVYELRDNYTEWEAQNNGCYEYRCVDGVAEWKKRKNATEWEARSNECYEYKCMNEGGGVYELRDNYTEWEGQSSECYEYRCIDGVAEWKKRENASEWEEKTNECIEYQCDNESGFLKWSICNSSDTVTRMCVDNKCVEKIEKNSDNDVGGRWAVEIEIDMNELKEVELNLTEVIEEIALLTGADTNDINVEVKTDENGNVLMVIVYIDSEESAKLIAEKINGNGGSEGCEYGRVLCLAKSAVVYAVETGTISQGPRHVIDIIGFAVLMYELM